MKKLQFFIIFILPFALYGTTLDLPYDYIDNDISMRKELAEYNARIKNKEKMKLEKLGLMGAETSGFMIGIGASMIYPINSNGNSVRDIGGIYSYGGMRFLINEQYKIEGIKAGGDLLLGYKWFSSSISSYWFGIRYYVDYNPRFLDIVVSHNITLNTDFLFNIVNKKPFNFGLFLGVGMGGAIEQINQKYCFLDKCNETFAGFSANLNLGFRFVIASSSAIELLTQFLFFLDMKDELDSFSDSSYENYTRKWFYQPSNNADTLISVGLRFVYTF